MQTRNTKQRATVRTVFENTEQPLSTDDVLQRAGALADGIGIATVYRAIAALVKEGWLQTVEIAGEPTRYERGGQAHHHHFQCDACANVFDIAGCIDGLRAILPPAFKMREHSVTFYGLCPRCSTASS